MKLMTSSRRLLLAVMLTGIAAPTLAATTTSQFEVKGTVVATCSSITASSLTFSTTIPTPVINDIDASSTISATCSNNVLYTIELDAGKGANATVASRKMSSNGNLVSYTMYTDAARTIIWGDGSAGTSVNSVRGTGSSQTIQVFGRIPKGQSPAIGAYTDTITLKLTF